MPAKENFKIILVLNKTINEKEKKKLFVRQQQTQYICTQKNNSSKCGMAEQIQN